MLKSISILALTNYIGLADGPSLSGDNLEAESPQIDAESG
jgi:hypothetical protein